MPSESSRFSQLSQKLDELAASISNPSSPPSTSSPTNSANSQEAAATSSVPSASIGTPSVPGPGFASVVGPGFPAEAPHLEGGPASAFGSGFGAPLESGPAPGSPASSPLGADFGVASASAPPAVSGFTPAPVSTPHSHFEFDSAAAPTSNSNGAATAGPLPAGALPDGAANHPGRPPGVVVVERPWRPVEATLALICGILLLGPAAVICGHLALRKIKKSNGVLPGKAEAWIGLGIGYPVTAILVLFLGLRMTVFFMSGGAAQL